MKLLSCTALTLTTIVVLQSSQTNSASACMAPGCPPNANFRVVQPNPNETIIIVAPGPCSTNDAGYQEGNFELRLEAQNIRLFNNTTGELIPFILTESPHNPAQHHVIATALDHTEDYRLEFEGGPSYDRATLEFQFSPPQAMAYPAAAAVPSVEVRTPTWEHIPDFSKGIGGDCSVETDRVRQITAFANATGELEPWSDQLVWTAGSDTTWSRSSASSTIGTRAVTIQRSCSPEDAATGDLTRIVKFKATLPGTELEWETPPETITLSCPEPEPTNPPDMGQPHNKQQETSRDAPEPNLSDEDKEEGGCAITSPRAPASNGLLMLGALLLAGVARRRTTGCD